MTKIEPPANEPLTMRILISYHYFQDVNVGAMIRKLQDLSGIEKMDVFADSGAFTAQSQGVHIELSEYVEWIHKWEEYLTVYLNLDVIGNQEGTNANQETLENKFGVHPVPVFTFQWHGSDYDTLAWQLDKYEYISLGGMVPFMMRPKAVMPHLIKCFKMAGDRAVFHGLGCTSKQILNNMPFYSVDSSSWSSGGRWRTVHAFDEKKGRWIRGDWKRHHGKIQESLLRLAPFFDRFGLDIHHAAFNKQGHWTLTQAQGLSYILMERWLRKRHKLISLPSKRDIASDRGLKIYLASFDAMFFNKLAEAFVVFQDKELETSKQERGGLDYGLA